MDEIAVETSDLELEPGKDLVLFDGAGTERLRLDAGSGSIVIRNRDSEVVIRIDAENRNLFLGGFGRDGDLLLFPKEAISHNPSDSSIHLDGETPSARIGNDLQGGRLSVGGPGHRIEAQGKTGRVELREGVVRLQSDSGMSHLVLNGPAANAMVGGNGIDGEVVIKDKADSRTIVLNGATANAGFGVDGNAGALFVKDDNGKNSIVLNGETGNAAFGNNGLAGNLFVKGNNGNDAIVVNGERSDLVVGQDGNGGTLMIRDNTGQNSVVINGANANLALGRDGVAGDVFVKNDQGENTIHLSGQSGDILIGNGDCAEQFDVSDCDVSPGDVLVIGEGGELTRSTRPYDSCVAGIVSGGGGYKPGIVLDKRETGGIRQQIALIGKVYCKIDAAYGAVSIGDLLTTSDTPGHAMRVSDPARAFGAVIGKALTSHQSGVGMVLVLVGLQ